ncbi:unnamed protein product [Linum tenue]|uniref:Pentatricopeptide repeat-containing protein n=1 Tax=Linum tenue TaxID=586396 RepID=A0AAV0QRG8_9ROSI|nr:unnamed protein product [Linum tenue]
MPQRNAVSWNSMISCYIHHDEFEEALSLFPQMQSEGLVPDGYTIVSALLACSKLGDLESGRYVHCLIRDWSQLRATASQVICSSELQMVQQLTVFKDSIDPKFSIGSLV